jgi:hypothetical protein
MKFVAENYQSDYLFPMGGVLTKFLKPFLALYQLYLLRVL